MKITLLKKIRKNISVYKTKSTSPEFIVEDNLSGHGFQFKSSNPNTAKEYYYCAINNHLRAAFGINRKSNLIKIL